VAVAVADVNGDGQPDVIATDLFDDGVLVWFGQGDGTFTAGQRFLVGVGPTAVAVQTSTGMGCSTW
jgi:FG-GAP-like repeat